MNALDHLAQLIHCIRPEWNTPGIRAALEATPHRDLHRLIRASIDAAYDPSARTPGVIPNRQGDGWVGTTQPKPPGTPEAPHIHQLDLGRPQPGHVAQRGAAAARAALANAPHQGAP